MVHSQVRGIDGEHNKSRFVSDNMLFLKHDSCQRVTQVLDDSVILISIKSSSTLKILLSFYYYCVWWR